MNHWDMAQLLGALEKLRTLEHKARDMGADILSDRLEVAVGYVMDVVDEMLQQAWKGV